VGAGGLTFKICGYSLFNSFDSWKKEIVLKNQVKNLEKFKDFKKKRKKIDLRLNRG
jgi:hypothetical protein